MDELSDSVSSDPVHDIVDLISSLDDYHGVLTQLLQERNLEGYTPFMAAVVCKVCARTHTHTLMVPSHLVKNKKCHWISRS